MADVEKFGPVANHAPHSVRRPNEWHTPSMPIDHRGHRGCLESAKDMTNVRPSSLIAGERPPNSLDHNDISGLEQLGAVPLRSEQPTFEALTVDLENDPTTSADFLRVTDDCRLTSKGPESNCIDCAPFH